MIREATMKGETILDMNKQLDEFRMLSCLHVQEFHHNARLRSARPVTQQSFENYSCFGCNCGFSINQFTLQGSRAIQRLGQEDTKTNLELQVRKRSSQSRMSFRLRRPQMLIQQFCNQLSGAQNSNASLTSQITSPLLWEINDLKSQCAFFRFCRHHSLSFTKDSVCVSDGVSDQCADPNAASGKSQE